MKFVVAALMSAAMVKAADWDLWGGKFDVIPGNIKPVQQPEQPKQCDLNWTDEAKHKVPH